MKKKKIDKKKAEVKAEAKKETRAFNDLFDDQNSYTVAQETQPKKALHRLDVTVDSQSDSKKKQKIELFSEENITKEYTAPRKIEQRTSLVQLHTINIEKEATNPNIETEATNPPYRRSPFFSFIFQSIKFIASLIVFIIFFIPLTILCIIVLLLCPFHLASAIACIYFEGFAYRRLGVISLNALLCIIYFGVGILSYISIIVGFYRFPVIVYYKIVKGVKLHSNKFYEKMNGLFSFFDIMYMPIGGTLLDIVTFTIPFLILVLSVHRLKSFFTRLRSMTFLDFLSTKVHRIVYNELYYFGYSWNYISDDVMDPIIGFTDEYIS